MSWTFTPWANRPSSNNVHQGPVVKAQDNTDNNGLNTATEGNPLSSPHETSELVATEKSHQWDPNLPQEKIEELHTATHNADPEAIRRAQYDFLEDSPYAEVRAAVKNIDHGENANTVRAWILGLLFVTIASGLNMFLSMRSPAINFPSIVVLLLVYPIANVWARVVPKRVFQLFGVQWTFNTGPFTIKEHTVITLMSSISVNYPYSTDALLALRGKPFYNLDMGWGFQLLFTLSSQVIGIGLAGLFRRFLIYPAALMWPSTFSMTALLHALHDKSDSDSTPANGWRISRYRYFCYLTLAAFCYYWIPGVLWQGLSVFAFVTWIRPGSITLNQLFGGFTGLSLIPLTFDWTYVTAYLTNPLLSPVHSHFNTLIGLVVFVVITTIGISFTGALYSDYLPLVTSQTFDNSQHPYNSTRILGPNFTFDLAKYKEYSPMFLPPAFALNYGLSFSALTAAVLHTIVFHRKEISYRFKAARNQEPDIHMKLVSKYAHCPDWWYGVLLFVSVMFGLAAILAYPSQLPWWAYFVSIILGVIFVLPTCMIYGIANIQLSLNVLSAFLGGYIMPGKPIAVMIFKVYSTIVLGQAQVFSIDLKLAHYMKIPPKTTFMCQLVATIWATFVQIAVMNWVLGNIPHICDLFQKDRFSCPNGRAFFSNSITWGLIGPARMLGPGSMYSWLHYYWLLGAALPVFFYILMRLFPKSPARFLNAPVMLGAMSWLPPATPLSFSSWAIVGLVFNFWIRRRWGGWWRTYNYVTAAALDSGLILGTVVVFFAIVLPGVEIPQWWGNVKVFETLDYLNTAYRKTVGEGETFGPTVW
ncbi:small oligopeptide transporter [Delitschia confertaspora ATCC 74209]|uniref:Small oligopeptide transporter n=1 Tax=Delitschia confertaspora ATCC 74209 TaxID=1513339 RepID=A0A9P4JNN9_9PLEO|nr:small oligopeptide transporter [Delitschia confertaspora ATCC 74209]